MYLVAIGWMYVVMMMVVAEATSSSGTLLGALITLLLYGLLPLAVALYLLNTPARRRARRAAAQAPLPDLDDHRGSSAPGIDPDQRGHAPGDPVAPVREES
jgi:membrane protein implicated in regulation of membrane protease activity